MKCNYEMAKQYIEYRIMGPKYYPCKPIELRIRIYSNGKFETKRLVVVLAICEFFNAVFEEFRL